MSVSWIEHKGKRILYVNYEGRKAEYMLGVLQQEINILIEQEAPVPTLDNYTNCVITNEFVNALKENEHLIVNKLEKSAVIGISGLKKALLIGYNMFAKRKAVPFNSREEAMDYLVS